MGDVERGGDLWVRLLEDPDAFREIRPAVRDDLGGAAYSQRDIFKDLSDPMPVAGRFDGDRSHMHVLVAQLELAFPNRFEAGRKDKGDFF